MGDKFKEGVSVYVVETVFINGLAAFRRGETVRIERVEQNLEQPEYKYVVYSKSLRNYYFLRDEDLSKKPASAAALPGRFSLDIFSGNWLWVLAGGFSIAVIAALVFIGYFFIFNASSPEKTARKYYEAIVDQDNEAFLSVVDLSEENRSDPSLEDELDFFLEDENVAGHVSKKLTYEVNKQDGAATVTTASSDGTKSTLTMVKKGRKWLVSDSFGLQYIKAGMYHTVFWDTFSLLDDVITDRDNADIDIDNICEAALNGGSSDPGKTLTDMANQYIPVYQNVLNEFNNYRQQFSVVTPPICPWYNTATCRDCFLMTIDGYGASVSEMLNSLTYCLDLNNMDNYSKAEAHVAASDQKESSAVDYYNQAVGSLNGILDAREEQLKVTF
ncbi:MAG: hypothetical protein JW738_09205 [Actinobacteria bacterium]|nr:hypothetical protein [Actinomycetota bacterium]